MVNILLSYPHILALTVWIIVAFLSVFRYLHIAPFTRVSWKLLIIFTIVFHLGYAVLLSWGQYVQWASNDFTKALLMAPLSPETPLPIFLKWARAYLEQPLGYFAFYSFGRFFLGSIVLFILTGFFALLLKLRARYQPINFAESDIPAIVLAVLISGWPGVVVLVPLGFLFAVLISLGARILYGIERVYLPPAFLIAAPIAIVGGSSILRFLDLYLLLKL